MKKFVEVSYDAETKETVIQYQEKHLDASKVKDVPISEWGNPFVKSGVRWYGLYEELKNLCEDEKFNVIFHGSESDMQLIKKMLSSKTIEVFSENNKVVLLYHRADCSTKITVNGKMFNVSAVSGVPLQELINPIEDRYWKGLFTELQEYMGNTSFNITFIGDSEDMNCLVQVCPENVDLFYKAPNSSVPKISTQAVSEKATALFDSAKTAMQNANVPESATALIGSAKTAMQNMNVPETVNVGGRSFNTSSLKSALNNRKILAVIAGVIAIIVVVTLLSNVFKSKPLEIIDVTVNKEEYDTDFYNDTYMDYEVTLKNISKKQIAYIDFEVEYYDKLGGYLDAELLPVSWTGPLEPGEETTIECFVMFPLNKEVVLPKTFTITFTDDKQVTFENDVYGYTDEFQGGKLKAKR